MAEQNLAPLDRRNELDANLLRAALDVDERGHSVDGQNLGRDRDVAAGEAPVGFRRHGSALAFSSRTSCS